MSLEVDSTCDASSSMSLEASPKRALVFMDTRTPKVYDELLADILPSSLLTAKRVPTRTWLRLQVPSPPSRHASLPSRSAMIWHCVV